jgi:hypothetical protein
MCARVSKSMPSNNEMVPMHFEYKNMNGRKMSRRCPPWAKTKARREDGLFTPIMDTYVVGWGGGGGGGYFALLSPPTNEESTFRVSQEGPKMFCDLVYLPKFGWTQLEDINYEAPLLVTSYNSQTSKREVRMCRNH